MEKVFDFLKLKRESRLPVGKVIDQKDTDEASYQNGPNITSSTGAPGGKKDGNRVKEDVFNQVN